MRRFAIALVAGFAITSAGFGYAFWFAADAIGRIAHVDVRVDALVKGGPINYLIIGSDSRAGMKTAVDAQHFGSANQETGQRSDTMMIVHVDAKSKKATLVSIPRDLWVNIPGRGLSKINAAFNSGPQTVIETIRANLHVPIHHYLEVDFFGFQQIVKAIGSVHLFFPSYVRDAFTGLSITQPGCNALNGEQALAYVRSRHYEYSASGRPGTWHSDGTADLGRIQRQQYFLRTLVQEAIDRGAHDPRKLFGLVDAVVPNLRDDPGFQTSDFQALARVFQHVDPGTVDMVTLPSTTGTSSGGQSIQNLDVARAAVVLATLRGEPPVGAAGLPKIAKASFRLRVLNGTRTSGLARRTLADLEHEGFAGRGAADASRHDYSQTEVQYSAGREDAARLTLAYLGGAGSVIKVATPSGADVVVVLGSDFQGVAVPSVNANGATTTTRAANPGSTPGVATPKPANGRPLVGCG